MGGGVDRPNSAFATHRWSKRSATTYEDFQANQLDPKGKKRGRDHSDGSSDYDSDDSLGDDSIKNYDHTLAAQADLKNKKDPKGKEDCQEVIDLLLLRFQQEMDKGPSKQKLCKSLIMSKL